MLEYDRWGCFHSPETVSPQHHRLDRLPMNLQQLSPEHFYCSATNMGGRYLRSTMLLCRYQLLNTLSLYAEIWQGYSVQRMATSASFHGGLTSQDDKIDLPSPLPSPSLKTQHATETKADELRIILLFTK